MLLGYYFRRWVTNFKAHPGLLVAAGLVFAASVGLSGARLDLDQRKLAEPLAVLAGSLSGIYLFLVGAKLLIRNSWLADFFSGIGRASLFVLIFHYPFWDLALGPIPMAWRERQPGCVGLATFVVSIALSVGVYHFAQAVPGWWRQAGWSKKQPGINA